DHEVQTVRQVGFRRSRKIELENGGRDGRAALHHDRFASLRWSRLLTRSRRGRAGGQHGGADDERWSRDRHQRPPSPDAAGFGFVMITERFSFVRYWRATRWTSVAVTLLNRSARVLMRFGSL